MQLSLGASRCVLILILHTRPDSLLKKDDELKRVSTYFVIKSLYLRSYHSCLTTVHRSLFASGSFLFPSLLDVACLARALVARWISKSCNHQYCCISVLVSFLSPHYIRWMTLPELSSAEDLILLNGSSLTLWCLFINKVSWFYQVYNSKTFAFIEVLTVGY